MRIAAIALPELRVELVRAASDLGGGEPLAIVVAKPPVTEASLLGNTRLDVVSREARALGIKPGQTLASARACASALTVRVVHPDAVRVVLARLAEVSLAFGATVSFATASESVDSLGDVVWVDITGCAHLHASKPAPGRPENAPESRSGELSGSRNPATRSRATGEGGDTEKPCFFLAGGREPARDDKGKNPAEKHFRTDSDGELVLGSRLARVIRELGHTCVVAIADGPRIAAIVARTVAASEAAQGRSRERRRHEERDVPSAVVVPPGKNALAVAPLPVSALPLAESDVRWLAKIGVRTVAELRALPRAALGTRLGTRARAVLSLAEGEDRAPLTPYIPPEVPEESATFEYGVEGSEALTFVAKMLTDRLAVRLAGRAVAAARLELDLMLDVASVQGDTTDLQRVQRLVLELPQPLSGASDLLAALRPKIERASLAAPVLGAKLRAVALVHKPQAALSLFEPQPKAERALPRLVAELAADLGDEAVGMLALGNAWTPEERSRFVRPFVTKATGDDKGRRRRHMLSTAPEPTRILNEPIPVPREAVTIVRHLGRIEATDWWKRLPGEGPQKGVDYVYAWAFEGAAWVEIDRATGAARVRGWFD